jgi:hypothetical protein
VFGAFSVDPISKKLQNGQTGQLQWQMAYLLINLSNNSEIQPDFRTILWFAKYVRPQRASMGSHFVKGEFEKP